MDNTDAHSKDLRKHRRMDDVGTFFVTKCVQPRRDVLTVPCKRSPGGPASHIENNHCIANKIVDTLRFGVERGWILLAAFVVMPDHWHALFGVNRPHTLPKVMQRLGSFIGRQSSKLFREHDVVWQDGYHDTRIRSGKQFSYILHYIENNPVKKELVGKTVAWQWSSANPEYLEMLTRPWPWVFEKDVG